MKNRKADIPYCGVDQDKIFFAEPELDPEALKLYTFWIMERYKIHLKKDVDKAPAPWTEDKVLNDFRFTNLRREQDRQTINLINSVSLNDKLSLEEKILNSILFRTWNRMDTFELLEAPYDSSNFEDPNFPDFLRDLRDIYKDHFAKNPKQVYWTPVFNTGGLKAIWFSPQTNFFTGEAVKPDIKFVLDGKEHTLPYVGFRDLVKERGNDIEKGLQVHGHDTKNPDYSMWERDIPLRVVWAIKWCYDNKIPQRIIDAKSQEEVFDILNEIPGIASFLGYQIFVDLTYIPEFPFSENDYTIAGPGCKNGINFLFKDRVGMSYEECIFWIRDNQEMLFIETQNFAIGDLFTDLEEHDQHLNVMSIENSFCEFQKYYKATKKLGRPKNKYKLEAKYAKLF